MDPENPKSPDPNHDPDLSELFQQAFGRTPPRDQFVSKLRDELAEELRNAQFSSRNGKAISQGGEVPSQQAVVSTAQVPAISSLDSGGPQHSVSRRTGRSLLVALASVALVAMVAVWTSQPSYSWTSVVRALERQPWVESAVNAEAGADVRQWFSRVNRVVIRQADDSLVWDDLQHGVRSRYVPRANVLEQSRLDERGERSVEQALVAFLLNITKGNSNTQEELFSGAVEVLEQDWRTVPGDHIEGVELDVLLGWGSNPDERLRLILHVDPETHLPRSCRVVDRDGADSNVIQFDYPNVGPQDVHDLGVPRNVAVRQVDDTSPPVRVAEAVGPTVNRSRSSIQSAEIKSLVVESENSPVQGGQTELQTQTAEAVQNAATPPLSPPVARSTPAISQPQMTDRVDELMQQLWTRSGISPVGECSDLEFLRRVYLDLTGRVPTVSEVREYLRDVPAGRRERLVEQLLGRRDHATHLAAVWRRFLLPEGVDLTQYGGTASFEEWLTDHFRANTSYDEVVRELLLAEGRVSESGPILFYTALKLEPEALAAQTARAFLGMRLECAQCHDHFFDNRWKQEDFWGYAAFFSRISRPQGKMDMVSPVLQVKDSNWGDVTLPDEEKVIPPRYPLGETLAEDGQADSRRRALADWMTAPQNPHFARATVNRVWAHLFGRGLVEPVDDMRSDQPPISPEVLDELAGYFVASGFGLRDLFRVIVLSETYQRTSSAPDDEPSRALHFAQMNIKSFTAEQLYDSIAVATRLETLAEEDGSLIRTANMSRQAFIEQFRAPPGRTTDYQSGIPQALTLMNGGLIQGATGLKSSGILRSLNAPFFSDEQRVETLFLATLSRPPDDIERQTMLDYVTEAESEREERLSDLLWALLNSAEFTLNH